MITIRLIDARRGLHQRCESLFRDKKIADQIYWYLCDGLEECDDAVKHGRWKEVSDDMYAGGGAWICSSCHYGFSWKAYSLLPEEKYCPHCGAKMDGEE